MGIFAGLPMEAKLQNLPAKISKLGLFLSINTLFRPASFDRFHNTLQYQETHFSDTYLYILNPRKQTGINISSPEPAFFSRLAMT